MKFQEIKDQEQEYIIHTYGRVDAALVKGRNATAWDVEGREYIDFTSGIGVNSLGYSDPDWTAAVSKQAGEIQHLCNYYYSPQNTALAQELCTAAGMAQAFFCNSGAEANECAIKIARKYGEKRGAYKIATLENSFHGRTLTTLAATGQEGFHKDFLPLTEGFLYAKAGDIKAMDALLEGSVCAVMIETVQGEGGVVPMDPDFLKALRALCDKRDVLLVIDEVQTGVGRTGHFYSYQGYGVQPDVVTSAKGLGGGLPIGICLVTEKLRDILKPGQQGSTFGGNPVVCAGAREVVRRVSSPEFLQTVREKGEYISKRLEKLFQVEFVRGRGLMLGIKLKSGDAHDVLVKCARQGLLVLTAKELVRFLPPLTITMEEIDKGLLIFEKVLQEEN
ncbi:acetylornithine/succinylornithine family transaminase [Acutalibacter muris]|uniref:acetylornithine/succinylornithine family transaminase n=1 Tax=Acutalibacter muris TaxID=1796620 RepID=UPI00272B80D3|nr:acetylornithine/succinylornithine family transaminase [Acutalibacter muris]